MDILAVLICVEHNGVLTEIGHNAQLYLTVIRLHEQPSLGRNDKIPHADIVVSRLTLVLQVGSPAGKAPGFGSQRQQVGMDATRGRVDEAQVTVDVGRFEFRPLAVFLYQLEQRHQLRAVLRVPALAPISTPPVIA